MSRTISAIFATSIIAARESEGHSKKVRRLLFDVTTVRGPVGWERVCFVYRLIKLLMRVVLPTPGGPTTAVMIGGASSGSLSTCGTWRRFSLMSLDRTACFCSRPGLATAKALTFFSPFLG